MSAMESKATVTHNLSSGMPTIPVNTQTNKPGVLIRRLYFRGFGLIYLIAFLSLWSQVHGLIGEQGLLPAGRFFQLAHERIGNEAYRRLPSLCWLGSGDFMLNVWCGLGSLLSLSLVIGLAPRLTLLLLWAIYLSLCIAGQDYLSFQWDTLLLEMTICSLLYAPRGWHPDWRSPSGPLACWLLWGLAFKLMFLSGATKLLSGDSSWIDGTALQYHYYTQPIPNWPAWYAYQCPLGIHRFALIVTLLIEVAFPFLIFAGQRGRTVFGLASIVLMVAIEVTGNFGFFNLQTIVLCLPLLNDKLLERLIPAQLLSSETVTTTVFASPKWRLITAQFVIITVLSVSSLTIVSAISSSSQVGKLPQAIINPIQLADSMLLSWGRPWILEKISPLRTINGYGLFRVMTVRRNEIVVEISDDGLTWSACEFPYKPGPVDRSPPIVAPHMPRLDWQMWFAALNPRGSEHWLAALVQRILEGSPAIARLLGHPELAKNPPKFVRLAYYEYKFTNMNQRHGNGSWWNRSFLGNLTEPVENRASANSSRRR